IFQEVTLSENHTLCWPNVLFSFTFKAATRSEPLELDALELYRQSKLIKKLEKIHIGEMFRQARLKAGLTQAKVAFNSGTTPKYISRIENDQSDIQLGTLQKIIELGIGQKMVISIEEKTHEVSNQKKQTKGSTQKRDRKTQVG
ncbi:MAG: helix-turn-helix transcriptional regulator, partial [Saprospiraceae bacterium]|nr:helix-turn-helix transcriptional regulator [Saprospiraceae bacterium]